MAAACSEVTYTYVESVH